MKCISSETLGFFLKKKFAVFCLFILTFVTISCGAEVLRGNEGKTSISVGFVFNPELRFLWKKHLLDSSRKPKTQFVEALIDNGFFQTAYDVLVSDFSSQKSKNNALEALTLIMNQKIDYLCSCRDRIFDENMSNFSLFCDVHNRKRIDIKGLRQKKAGNDVEWIIKKHQKIPLPFEVKKKYSFVDLALLYTTPFLIDMAQAKEVVSYKNLSVMKAIVANKLTPLKVRVFVAEQLYLMGLIDFKNLMVFYKNIKVSYQEKKEFLELCLHKSKKISFLKNDLGHAKLIYLVRHVGNEETIPCLFNMIFAQKNKKYLPLVFEVFFEKIEALEPIKSNTSFAECAFYVYLYKGYFLKAKQWLLLASGLAKSSVAKSFLSFLENENDLNQMSGDLLFLCSSIKAEKAYNQSDDILFNIVKTMQSKSFEDLSLSDAKKIASMLVSIGYRELAKSLLAKYVIYKKLL